MKKIIVVCLALVVIVACDNDQEVTLNEEIEETVVPDLDLETTVVYEWTDQFLELEQYASGRPNGAARAIAYIYLAAYETAVPQMNGLISLDDRLRGLRIRGAEDGEAVNTSLALNACFEEVINHFLLDLPEELSDQASSFAQEMQDELALDVDESVLENSLEWGQYVANEVIRYSQRDGEAEAQILDPQPLSYEPPVGEGYWTYSADPERALFPYWESVRTFIISPDETTSVPPIAYSEDPESEYYAEMVEIYEENNSAREEDGEQLWIAEFWSDDVEDLMISPPARQISVANQLVAQYDLGIEETLSLFVKVGFALNDAAVAAWKYKYEYMVMRPNVFIHEFMNPDFQTNLYRLIYWPNPSFPGYPSGHSTFASAAGGVFIDHFGSTTNFTDRTHEGREEFRGEPRSFFSFEEMAAENAFSRIPLGVHMRMDCAEGLRLGYEIADAINAVELRVIEGI